MSFTVKVSYDDAARVWFIHETDVPGLHAEAATLDELVTIIEDVTPDLIPDAQDLLAAPAGVPVCIQHIATAKRARAA